MAKNSLDISKELQTLNDEISSLENQIKLENDVISSYEMGAAGGYESGPSAEEDDALRRALAEQAYAQAQFSPSNVLAQLSMVREPQFAGVFKDATGSRVNAARQYFGDLGKIQRDAQSRRAASARSKKRSDAKLRGLVKTLGEAKKARRGLNMKPLDVEGRQIVAATPTYRTIMDPRDRETVDIPRKIKELRIDNQTNLQKLNPTLREQIAKGADPRSLLSQATPEEQAIFANINANEARIRDLSATERRIGPIPTATEFNKDARSNPRESSGSPSGRVQSKRSRRGGRR